MRLENLANARVLILDIHNLKISSDALFDLSKYFAHTLTFVYLTRKKENKMRAVKPKRCDSWTNYRMKRHMYPF